MKPREQKVAVHCKPQSTLHILSKPHKLKYVYKNLLEHNQLPNCACRRGLGQSAATLFTCPVPYRTASKQQVTGRPTCLTFRHRASCLLGQAFHYSPENAFIYLINKYISLSDIWLTVHH